MNKTPPCVDCTERTPGCHSHCERYISWRKEFDAEKEKIKKAKKDQEASFRKNRNFL